MRRTGYPLARGLVRGRREGTTGERPPPGWLERRATVTPEMQFRSELGSTKRPVLSWESPMSLGGERIEAGGRIVWIPPEERAASTGSGTVPWRPLTTAAVALFVVGGILVFVRRQGASSA